MKSDSIAAGLTFGQAELLRWLYLGRFAVVAGILAGALLRWLEADPQQTLVVTVMSVAALSVTAASLWYTHVLKVRPGENFLYMHVVIDVLLVTGIVHITGGQESDFAPLYILAISEGALLLPLAGGVLVGALVCILYFADLFWFHQATFTGPVAYQVVLFAAVALVTGLVGDRLRGAGIALGAVESELRQLRLDTSDILANISTGVLTVDGGGRLAYLNPAGEALLGLDAAEWLGAPVVSTVDEVAPGVGTVLRRSIEESLPITRFRTTARRKEKDIVLGVSTTVLDRQDGERPSATALFQDISELERVEALHRRAERLEAVAELSASLAHEIKNPLASIRSAVEQIAKPALDREDRLLLERLVVTESDRLSRLLSEFLDFSAIAVVTPEVVDLSRLVSDAVTLAKQHPEHQRDGVIELECPPEPLRVLGDPDLLHRAVFNLVLNALQFTPASGRVNVELRPRTSSEGTTERAMARLVVRDQGPGVAAEDVPRIFDPFYTRREGGTGLGLAVVHRSVEAHDGEVTVGRAFAGGAEFIVDLPLVAGASPEEAS